MAKSVHIFGIKTILLVCVIIISLNSYAHCFFDKLQSYAKQFDYPAIALENDIKFDLTFAIVDKKIWLVSSQRRVPLELLQKILNFDRIHNCALESVPDTFMVKFQLDTIDHIYVENNALIIQKKGYGYYWKDEIEVATFTPNSKINWKHKKDKCDIKIDKGNKLVFHYYHSKGENPMLKNDENFREIYFQIPKNVMEFKYQNLAKINLYHNSTHNPRCKRDEYKPKGLVTGKKLANGNWKIRVKYYANVDTIFVLNK